MSLLVWIGCANEMPPPGARPDAIPPQVERIVPGRDTVVPGFDDDARIRFDEPVNLSSSVERQFKVSPAERYEFGTSFSELRFKPESGWRDGVVYCFELEEGISDLLNNRTVDPIEFCFSTGPPIAATRITGQIIDVLTGRPSTQAQVHFLQLPTDSMPYAAVADQEGNFSQRAIPPGGYTAFGFVDQNRNLRLDRRLEPHDSLVIDLLPDGRLNLEFRLIPPDSTPPLLVQAEASDSLTLRLQFDDPLPREQPEDSASVTVTEIETGVTVDVVAALVGEPGTVTLPDSAGIEEVEEGAQPPQEAQPPEEVAPPPDPEPTPADEGRAGDQAISQAELPSTTVSVRLAAGLRSGAYRVRAEGFVNLRGLTGGGDTTIVYEPPAPDSAGVEGEGAAAAPDSVRPDSVPPDSVRPDSIPPDTLRADGERFGVDAGGRVSTGPRRAGSRPRGDSDRGGWGKVRSSLVGNRRRALRGSA